MADVTFFKLSTGYLFPALGFGVVVAAGFVAIVCVMKELKTLLIGRYSIITSSVFKTILTSSGNKGCSL